MSIRKFLPFGFLVVCGIFAAVTPLRSADDPKAAADAPEPKPEPLITKIYDIRPMIVSLPDFPLETSPHAPAFYVPGNRQGPTSAYGGYGNGGGGAGSGAERVGPTKQEIIEQIAKLITDLVDTETWRDNGGTIGSIRELQGMFIITQTAAHHKEIAALLHQLAQQRGQALRTTVDWVILPPADVDKLLNVNAAKEHAAVREVDPAALANLPASVRHFHADLMGTAGQVVHFISGRERTVTVGQQATLGTDVGAYSPEIGNVGDGIALQVMPIVDSDLHSVYATIFSTFNDAQEPSAPVAVNLISPGQQGTHAAATYRELNGIVQEFRTTLRFPVGVPVIAGSMTLEPSAKNAEALRLVMIVKVQAVE